MANEASIIELLGNGGDVVRYTVADGTAISAGSLMVVSEPRTIAKSSNPVTSTEFFVGVAAADKEASDGSTTLGVYTKGIFDMYCFSAGAVTAGTLVVISGGNTVVQALDDTIETAGCIVGKALEDAGAATAERIAVLIGTR